MTASVALSFARAVVTAPRTTFTDAVRDYQDEVYGVALRITGDRESALDVTSTTFLKAYRAFARYDQTRPIRFWLLRIATNEAISHARRAGRELRRRTAVESADEVARLARPRFAAATLASASLAGLAGALLVAAAFVGIGAIAPALVSEILASAIAFLASAAVPIDGTLRIAEDPTVPVAVLVCLGLAIAYEQGQRRERAHVIGAS